MATPALQTTLCDLSALEDATVETIDLLARLQLAARRQGRTLLFVHASPALRNLIAFCGLDAALRVEPEREAEEGEDPFGVEEERQLDDPAA
jgi:ABC-type transporter Mla MlaB component